MVKANQKKIAFMVTNESNVLFFISVMPFIDIIYIYIYVCAYKSIHTFISVILALENDLMFPLCEGRLSPFLSSLDIRIHHRNYVYLVFCLLHFGFILNYNNFLN